MREWYRSQWNYWGWRICLFDDQVC